MGLSSSNIKKFLCLGKLTFFILYETATPKTFLTFSQNKTFLIFWETETPIKFFIFKDELPKPPKNKVSYISAKRVMNKFF